MKGEETGVEAALDYKFRKYGPGLGLAGRIRWNRRQWIEKSWFDKTTRPEPRSLPLLWSAFLGNPE